jgi:hypothetical protein
MAARRKLKVFAAPFGFFDTIVAVPSRTAALRAWDVRQNLFHEGYAHEVEDPELVAAAAAHPGQVLRRPIGSNKPFVADPRSLPEVPPPARRGKAAGRPKAKAATRKPPPDRTALDRAEDALNRLEDARKAEAARLEARRAELDAEVARAREAYNAARRDAKAALEKARAAYRKAGGEDV